MTSEAVTNAINACAAKGCTTPVTLHAGWPDPTRLRVLVHDEAPGLPTVCAATDGDEGGRGVQLISYGADAWGVHTHGPGTGKAAWFELVGSARHRKGSDILDAIVDIQEVLSWPRR